MVDRDESLEKMAPAHGAETGRFDLDAGADLLAAMSALADVLRSPALKTESSGTGELPCPKCKGKLRFNFERRKRGSRRLSYVAWCETDGCIRFSGH